jgi:hypothetical protein
MTDSVRGRFGRAGRSCAIKMRRDTRQRMVPRGLPISAPT